MTATRMNALSAAIETAIEMDLAIAQGTASDGTAAVRKNKTKMETAT